MANERTYETGSANEGYAPAEPKAGFEPKEEGKHRWCAIVMYGLTPNQAAAADAGSQVVLSPEMLVEFTVGCIDCEEEYHKCRINPCTAGDTWARR